MTLSARGSAVARCTRPATRPFLGLNRAQAAVLEAAILATRLQMLPRTKVEQELDYLAIAIGKTAGEQEREAWRWLMEAMAAAGITTPELA